MIYVIVGPSGVGKTTVAKRLGIAQIISTTTRKMREGEVDRETYHFCSVPFFEELTLIERVEYSGNHYGLQQNDVQEAIDSKKDHYVILDRKGAIIMKELFNGAFVPPVIKIIYLKASPEELVGFMRKRGDDWEQVIERLCNIIRDKELDNDDIADLIITSTNLNHMEQEIKRFIKKH